LIARPARHFLATEAAGGIVLLAATVVALAWANSPFSDSYSALWETRLRIQLGDLVLDEDLRHWVNDALMAIFFFVVGLEIKRELVVGELNELRRAALPVFAAVGGMVVPALLYALLNAGGPGGSGWGIPMATDIAFAVGVLALLSNRVPSGLKVFLLSLAIVDDIGAILVIALFYSGGIQAQWLVIAGLLLALIVVLRRVRVLWVPVYVVIGTVVWLAIFESGVHATIAGVALGLLTPARPTDPGGFPDVLEHAANLSSEPDAQSLRAVAFQAAEVVSVAERLEHLLHPWTSYLIIPLFALANAGIAVSGETLGDAIASPVALGIILGLVAGKVIGISAFSWFAIKLRLAEAPEGVRASQLVGTAAVAGIGFTVSLFITALAFDEQELVDVAKMGVLIASSLAGLLGATILLLGPRSEDPAES
jgi:NhaA family Na+:H+ antiporter